MARKYQCIWEQLKSTGKCIITADPVLHARIKKAVTKEKYNDMVYKVECDIDGAAQPVLAVTNAKDAAGRYIKNTLVFTLVKPISLKDL